MTLLQGKRIVQNKSNLDFLDVPVGVWRKLISFFVSNVSGKC